MPRKPAPSLRRFVVERRADVNGHSGTGLIMVGTEFPDGRCVIQWQTKIRSMTFFDSIQEIEEVHGHDGQTVIKWLD